MGPCAKVRVLCEIVTPEGHVFRGENACRNPQATCPREPGEGYAKCRDICRQEGHAEEMALKAARQWAVGATAYITFCREEPGHVCDGCQCRMKAEGIVAWHLVDYGAAKMRDYPIGSPSTVTRARGSNAA